MTAPFLDNLMGRAQARAAENGHAFAGSEHLLAALLADPASLTNTLFTKAGLDAASLGDSLLVGVKKGPAGDTEPPPVSGFARRVIETVSAEAGKRGAEPDERELLRALLAQPKGRISQVLQASPNVLTVVRAALGDADPPPSEKPPRTRPERERKPERDKPAPRERGRPVVAERETASPGRDRTPAEPPARPERPRRESGPPRLAVPLPSERTPFPWIRAVLLLAVPASLALRYFGAPAIAIFAVACLGVLPLAGLMGDATESLADRTGPTVGGLLNATFGNAAELIIAIVALNAGLVDLVKASITGSILGNLLLILGLSFIAGGGKHQVIKFNRSNAGMSSAMLALAVVGLAFPALFHSVHGPPNQRAELYLSEAVAGILILTYACSLFFSLKTHKALFGGGDHPAITPKWSVGVSIVILGLATLGVVIESELLVHVVEAVTVQLGFTQTFLGLIIIPIIGNAAEHATAIVVARKGQADLALQIALGSSTQVALLIAPILVFMGLILGTGMNLVFSTFEVVALGLSTVVIAIITLDGEAHWFEGVQLIAVYGMIAAAAFFI